MNAAELGSGSFLVSVSGPLEADAVALLRDALIPLVATRDAHVIVDLSSAAHLDRAAVASLAAAAEIADTGGGTLGLVGVRTPVGRMFSLWGVDRLFSSAPTLASALRVDG